MEEHTIRLLCIEQATKELIQGASSDQGVGDDAFASTLPRFMRLDVPKFSGSNPYSWIFSITEYFSLLNTPIEQRLHVVGFNLEGEAAEWFRWMMRNNLITTWDAFLESVRNRFGPCKYEDPQGALSKLLQMGTVAQYQSEFEILMNRVTGISDSLLISFYISGLKPILQLKLLVSKLTSLGDAFSLARVTEACLEGQWSPSTGTKPYNNTSGFQNQKPTTQHSPAARLLQKIFDFYLRFEFVSVP